MRWSTDKLEELYTAVKIEKLKFYLSHYELEEYLTYNYYDKVINVNNYYLYEKDFNKYFGNYQRLKKIEDNASYILCYIEDYYYGNDKERIIKNINYFREKNLNVKSDLYGIDIYEKEFEKVSKEIKKERDEEIKEMKRIRREEKRREREREERRNRNYNNNSYRSNYSSSSSSNNSDLKKSYVKLCRYCKNNCVCCKRVIKGSEMHTGKAFGLHNKCQINSCFICGTSKGSDEVRERQTSYLCKSCYNSQKLDWTTCISCHKWFSK